MAETITLVTAFYNLQTVETEIRSDKYSDDYWKFFHLVLRINRPLIIYTSPDLVDKFDSLRESYGPDVKNNTHIISRKFSDLEYAELFDKMKFFRRNITSGNCILGWNKFTFLKDAAKSNHFNTDHFGWIDLDIRLTCREVDPAIFTSIVDKIKIMIVRHSQPSDSEDIKRFFSYNQKNVALGYITGPLDYIIKLYDEISKLIDIFVSNQMSPSDDQLISYLVNTKPELFEFFYGDISSQLLNYTGPRSDLQAILLNLATCKSLGLYNYGQKCGSEVWKSLKSGILRYNEDQLHTFLIDYFICLTSSIEQNSLIDRSKEIVNFYTDRVSKVARFKELYNNNSQLINKLFKLFDVQIQQDAPPSEYKNDYLSDLGILYEVKPNDQNNGLIIRDSIFDFKFANEPNYILEKKYSLRNDDFIISNQNSDNLHLYMNSETPNDILEYVIDQSSNSLNRYVACIWLALKLKNTHLIKSIGYLTLAISIQPNRIESYAIIGTIYREKADNILSTSFSTIIDFSKYKLSSLITSRNDLMCRKNVLDDLYYNLSICGFYTSKKDLGRDACDQLLLYSNQYRSSANQNLQYYLDVLPVITRIELKPKTPLIAGSNEYYKPDNPSIITRGDKYLVLCRTVNFSLKNRQATIYSPDGMGRTENVMLEMNSNFEVIENHHVLDKSNRITFNTMSRGLEDGRLFVWDNQIYSVSSFADSYPNTHRTGLIKFNSEYDVESVIGFEPETYTKCEKNWIPIVNSDNKLELMYMYDQRHIVIPEFDPRESVADRITCRRKDNFTMKPNLSWIRGGTVHIPYKDGFLCIIHEALINAQVHKYYHRFIYLDTDYTPIKMSDVWWFGQADVEYVTGLCWSLDKKHLVITYGLNENFAFLTVIDPNVIKLKDI